MAFDLKEIRTEIEATPLQSPYSVELGTAVVSDVLRVAGVGPPTVAAWSELVSGKGAPAGVKVDLRPEQLGMLGFLLGSSPALRDESVAAIRATAAGGAAPGQALSVFFEAVWPLTAEMIRANLFRQEELVRRWIAVWGGRVAGEEESESARRLAQLDYRVTLAEYEKAEKSRAEEADRRAEALRKAEEAEAAARGWRE